MECRCRRSEKRLHAFCRVVFAMPVIKPFRASAEPWSGENVFHDNDLCMRGQAIPEVYRAQGAGHMRHCLECSWWTSREADAVAASMLRRFFGKPALQTAPGPQRNR